VEVDVELPVGEPPGQPVGGMDRQGRLADPRGPLDGGDHRGSLPAGRREQPLEPEQLRGAAGEAGDVGWQLARHRHQGRRGDLDASGR
jgi:hypothetical protein